MLEALVGSGGAERTLLFLEAREAGYAREICELYGISLSVVQKHLQRMEAGGLLVSDLVGRTRVFRFNPRFPFLKETRALLRAALNNLPEPLREQLLMNRRRPRRTGKPL
ncbi:winged helix-turn-helix domain-containing protein [Microbulbifer rhizosphaerae]|uniref:DNA-binding transcriptional ArsR family regulator n=1 Tax=Microbulbifer rhizosphaerae TaxID=1562603 RepID=A0A7W4WCX1_9GAMM|nr:winged helix-turn-helix domain-containing protein [Microbulbifer rhizosphaerae]MBB3061880.1 DNA-binding transcriptional ArsR family regulator [Microbulbifer rhizosphaerae]